MGKQFVERGRNWECQNHDNQQENVKKHVLREDRDCAYVSGERIVVSQFVGGFPNTTTTTTHCAKWQVVGHHHWLTALVQYRTWIKFRVFGEILRKEKLDLKPYRDGIQYQPVSTSSINQNQPVSTTLRYDQASISIT